MFSWPVSGTHAIISALIGFTLVEVNFFFICSYTIPQNQWAGVNPGDPNPFCGSGIFKVLYGLFVSPALALVIGFFFYGGVYSLAIAGKKATSRTSRLIFSLCVFVMFWTIGFQMATAKSIIALEGYPSLITTTSCFDPNNKVFGIIVGIIVGLLFTIPFHSLLLPRLLNSSKAFYLSFDMLGKKSDAESSLRLEKISSQQNIDHQTGEEEEEEVKEDQEVRSVFQPLQVLAACFAALNHGGNDVGNCIGPLVTVYAIYAVGGASCP